MTELRNLFGCLIVAFAVAAPTRAADLPSGSPEKLGFSSERLARIGPVIEGEIKRGQYPGAVILVARKGQIVYFESFGQLDPASGKTMTKDAIFRLYSMTKPYTSVAAMMLVEEGRLRLTDPVSKYIPSFAKLEVSVASTDPSSGAVRYSNVAADREITVQDLLRHTSGLVYSGFTAHTKVKELYTKDNVGWQDMTPAEQIERLAKVPLAHQPGTTFEYGLSVDVLGRVIEAISGMPLGQFIQERIFMPLGMTDSAFFVPKEKLDRLAQPFATDPATGSPINLVDVTLPPKNDAGGGQCWDGGGLRPLSADDAQWRATRWRPADEPDYREVHDFRSSRRNKELGLRGAAAGDRIWARLCRQKGNRPLRSHRNGR